MYIIGSILGGILLLVFICCLCGTCTRDSTKSPLKADYYPRTSKSTQETKKNE